MPVFCFCNLVCVQSTFFFLRRNLLPLLLLLVCLHSTMDGCFFCLILDCLLIISAFKKKCISVFIKIELGSDWGAAVCYKTQQVSMEGSKDGRLTYCILVWEARSLRSIHHMIHHCSVQQSCSSSRWHWQMKPSENFHY